MTKRRCRRRHHLPLAIFALGSHFQWNAGFGGVSPPSISKRPGLQYVGGWRSTDFRAQQVPPGSESHRSWQRRSANEGYHEDHSYYGWKRGQIADFSDTPLSLYWNDVLPDIHDLFKAEVADADSFGGLAALAKASLTLAHIAPLHGPDGRHSPLWLQPVLLDWLWRSGRLGAGGPGAGPRRPPATGDPRAPARGWWACVARLLVLAPFLGAVDAAQQLAAGGALRDNGSRLARLAPLVPDEWEFRLPDEHADRLPALAEGAAVAAWAAFFGHGGYRDRAMLAHDRVARERDLMDLRHPWVEEEKGPGNDLGTDWVEFLEQSEYYKNNAHLLQPWWRQEPGFAGGAEKMEEEEAAAMRNRQLERLAARAEADAALGQGALEWGDRWPGWQPLNTTVDEHYDLFWRAVALTVRTAEDLYGEEFHRMRRREKLFARGWVRALRLMADAKVRVSLEWFMKHGTKFLPERSCELLGGPVAAKSGGGDRGEEEEVAEARRRTRRLTRRLVGRLSALAWLPGPAFRLLAHSWRRAHTPGLAWGGRGRLLLPFPGALERAMECLATGPPLRFAACGARLYLLALLPEKASRVTRRSLTRLPLGVDDRFEEAPLQGEEEAAAGEEEAPAAAAAAATARVLEAVATPERAARREATDLGAELGAAVGAHAAGLRRALAELGAALPGGSGGGGPGALVRAHLEGERGEVDELEAGLRRRLEEALVKAYPWRERWALAELEERLDARQEEELGKILRAYEVEKEQYEHEGDLTDGHDEFKMEARLKLALEQNLKALVAQRCDALEELKNDLQRGLKDDLANLLKTHEEKQLKVMGEIEADLKSHLNKGRNKWLAAFRRRMPAEQLELELAKSMTKHAQRMHQAAEELMGGVEELLRPPIEEEGGSTFPGAPQIEVTEDGRLVGLDTGEGEAEGEGRDKSTWLLKAHWQMATLQERTAAVRQAELEATLGLLPLLTRLALGRRAPGGAGLPALPLAAAGLAEALENAGCTEGQALVAWRRERLERGFEREAEELLLGYARREAEALGELELLMEERLEEQLRLVREAHAQGGPAGAGARRGRGRQEAEERARVAAAARAELEGHLAALQAGFEEECERALRDLLASQEARRAEQWQREAREQGLREAELEAVLELYDLALALAAGRGRLGEEIAGLLRGVAAALEAAGPAGREAVLGYRKWRNGRFPSSGQRLTLEEWAQIERTRILTHRPWLEEHLGADLRAAPLADARAQLFIQETLADLDAAVEALEAALFAEGERRSGAAAARVAAAWEEAVREWRAAAARGGEEGGGEESIGAAAATALPAAGDLARRLELGGGGGGGVGGLALAGQLHLRAWQAERAADEGVRAWARLELAVLARACPGLAAALGGGEGAAGAGADLEALLDPPGVRRLTPGERAALGKLELLFARYQEEFLPEERRARFELWQKRLGELVGSSPADGEEARRRSQLTALARLTQLREVLLELQEDNEQRILQREAQKSSFDEGFTDINTIYEGYLVDGQAASWRDGQSIFYA